MSSWRRIRFTVAAVVASGIAWIIWTIALPALGPVDELWATPAPDLQHWLGQLGATIAIVTAPPVIYAVLLAVAFWASRRQLTTLAAALVLSGALTFGLGQIAKSLMARARPDSHWDFLFTTTGYSYPSGHMTAITTAALMLFVTNRVIRRGAPAALLLRIVMPLAVIVVAMDRLILRAHFVTDVVGGLLLGGLAASLACLICGVHLPRRQEDGYLGSRRAAVIYNPTKIRDQNVFKGLVERKLLDGGWEPPIWLSTAATDPGVGMAQTALESHADLILVAGGDGTVRIVSSQLAGTNTPMAILPSGTGNLLAQNLDIPLDLPRALEVALRGKDGAIDVLKVSSPGREDDYAVVMCGVGADAAVIHDTNEDLKRQIGVGAYIVAGLGHIRTRPVRTTVTIDDEDPFTSDASLAMVCNVSDLQAGLTLIPEATADDGLLDVLVASPQSQAELMQLMTAVLARTQTPDTLVHRTGRKVNIEVAEEQLFELDGDVQGMTSELNFEVMPGALRLRLPH